MQPLKIQVNDTAIATEAQRLMGATTAGYNGFTTMKLSPLVLKSLIVIAIPIVVMAILFPVFARARERARRSSCASNLKQFGLAFAQYAQDHDDHLPPVKLADHASKDFSQVFGWADSLQPYLKSTSLNQCPSDISPPGLKSEDGQYIDYYMNARISGAKIKNIATASVILLGDGIGDKRGTARYALTSPPDQHQSCGGYNGRCQSAWKHLGGANFGFLDGHIKWLRPNEFSATKGASATFAPSETV